MKKHSKALVFFALSKQIPIVYSVDRGRAEITSLGKERAGLCSFRAFVCLFCTVHFCPVCLPLGVRDWLLFLTVAFPGLLY